MHFCYVVNDNASIMRATLPARYLLRPFQDTELPFAAVSVTLSLPKLLAEAVEPT